MLDINSSSKHLLQKFFLQLLQIFIFKIAAAGTDFKNTDHCQICSKIPASPVKYRPSGSPKFIFRSNEIIVY